MQTVAHILYMDIVGSSLLPRDAMTGVYDELNLFVQQTPQYALSMQQQTLLCRPTGDGMAMIFAGEVSEPVQCAVEISRLLAGHATIKLRIGIHSGEVEHVKDINGHDDVTGEGIIMAKRIMDCGDAGHILLSASTADLLTNASHWAASIRFLGTCQVKHGKSIALWNFCNDKAGNKNVPNAIVNTITSTAQATLQEKSVRKKKLLVQLAMAALILGILTPLFIYLCIIVGAMTSSSRP